MQFLLNGIADDKLDIGPKCIQFLEAHGLRMREALKALGVDEEEEDAETKDSKLQPEVKAPIIEVVDAPMHHEVASQRISYGMDAMDMID